jgi:CRP/FNR family cyclic AMP-dependent transcriptional regulator
MKQVLFLFGELSDLDVDWLIAQGRTEKIAQGTVLIQQGKPIGALYIILDGLFGVSVASGGQRELARMAAGEIIGEISFVDSRPPTTTVQAVADSVVFSIARERLSAKLKQDLGFAARFYRALAVFMSHRLRMLTLKFSQRAGEAPSAEVEAASELDADVLAGVYLGGRRFERMLKKLTAS